MAHTVMTWSELFAIACAGTILMVGAIWAIMRAYFNQLKRSLQTQLEGLHFTINSLAAAVTDMKTSNTVLASGITEGLNRIEKLRSDVDFVNGNVARIATLLGHLAATPPSFPPDLR
jgi:hypothetical protein